MILILRFMGHSPFLISSRDRLTLLPCILFGMDRFTRGSASALISLSNYDRSALRKMSRSACPLPEGSFDNCAPFPADGLTETRTRFEVVGLESLILIKNCVAYSLGVARGSRTVWPGLPPDNRGRSPAGQNRNMRKRAPRSRP